MVFNVSLKECKPLFSRQILLKNPHHSQAGPCGIFRKPQECSLETCGPGLGCSKCHSQTTNFHITWALVRNGVSGPISDLSNPNLHFHSVSREFVYMLKFQRQIQETYWIFLPLLHYNRGIPGWSFLKISLWFLGSQLRDSSKRVIQDSCVIWLDASVCIFDSVPIPSQNSERSEGCLQKGEERKLVKSRH